MRVIQTFIGFKNRKRSIYTQIKGKTSIYCFLYYDELELYESEEFERKGIAYKSIRFYGVVLSDFDY